MWKSKKPKEEKETFVAQKEEKPMIAFEEKEPAETEFEPKPIQAQEEVINIGKSVSIKGELTGDEDLTIEGRVEGKIALKDHNLVIGPHGKIKGQIDAKNVVVMGKIVGNISAAELVEIKATGSVAGDIKSSRISIEEGAYFKGSFDVQTSMGTTEGFDFPRAKPVKVSREQSALAERQTI